MKNIAGFVICVVVLMTASCGSKEETDNKPSARFSVSGYELPIPNPINFINISLNATSSLWNFGDGNTSTESNPIHTYSARGTYLIKLRVTGPAGADSTCKLLTLETPAPAGKSVFSYYQEKCSGTPVGISFKTINPASTNPVWDFGGGRFSLERDPIFQFLLPGDYTLKYSTLIGGTRDTLTRAIRID